MDWHTHRRLLVPAFFMIGCVFGTSARLTAQTTVQPVRIGQTFGYGETPLSSTPSGQPAAQASPLPIDLVTVLRLVDANNPSINLAKARVEESYQRWQQAKALWLPTLTAGSTYLRHDGQIQRAQGDVFTTSRSSLFAGGGAFMRFDFADALFLPLVSRLLTEAEAARSLSVTQNRQLDAALAYFDLLQIHGAIAVNADTLSRAEQMLSRAVAADKIGLSKNKSDVNRAETEVNLRKQEAIVLRGRAAAASARLVRLLLLDPTIELVPAEITVLPVTLLPPNCTLESLLYLGYAQRPEMAFAQAQLGASEARVQQARLGPLVPKMQLEYLGGTFGGGINSSMGNFDGRGDGTASVFWELRNLGVGNVSQVRERRAVLSQARYNQQEIQAQVAAEIAEYAKLAGARFQSLDNAQKAVANADEMYRKLLETSFGMIGPRAQYDALEPLLAIQSLNQARTVYLNEVIEFNRSQFRLYTAIGQPALQAMQSLTTTPVSVPVLPAGNPAPK